MLNGRVNKTFNMVQINQTNAFSFFFSFLFRNKWAPNQPNEFDVYPNFYKILSSDMNRFFSSFFLFFIIHNNKSITAHPKKVTFIIAVWYILIKYEKKKKKNLIHNNIQKKKKKMERRSGIKRKGLKLALFTYKIRNPFVPSLHYYFHFFFFFLFLFFDLDCRLC